jgi:hypothetical protein
MKSGIISLLCIISFAGNVKMPAQSDNIEFSCMKKQMASNQCHYNFIMDGAKYRYVDIGCHFKKKDQVIEKVKDGTLGLAKGWKIACPEVKEQPTANDTTAAQGY